MCRVIPGDRIFPFGIWQYEMCVSEKKDILVSHARDGSKHRWRTRLSICRVVLFTLLGYSDSRSAYPADIAEPVYGEKEK